jgi:hypothetical protein
LEALAACFVTVPDSEVSGMSCMDEDQLTLGFTGRHRSPLMRRLAAMAAPIAADAGAVIDDEELLAVARAVCDAFSHDDAAGGLTKAEIVARVGNVCPPETLDARLGVFVRMELLRPILDKKHQQRYVLAPAGLVGVLIVDRFSARGGVEELLGLLDRTAKALERHEADAPAVSAALEGCRAMFAVFANELSRLVATAPLGELLEERRFHDDSGFLTRVGELQRMVTDQFPALDPAAYKLLLEAQRYVGAVEDLLGRVLDEGGEARNFSLLDPEEYLDAARTATVQQLAEVAADIAFDPALPWVDAGAVVEAVEKYRPRRSIRVRPPEPPAAGDKDPVEQLQERADLTVRRRVLQAGRHRPSAAHRLAAWRRLARRRPDPRRAARPRRNARAALPGRVRRCTLRRRRRCPDLRIAGDVARHTRDAHPSTACWRQRRRRSHART